jgi:inner membrane protein
MDNVTHALAGLLLADITVRLLERRQATPAESPDSPVKPVVRRTAAVLGVVAAEFPDLDIVYSGPVLGMGKLGYLLHHRGHTHTLLLALVAGVVLWALTLLFVRAVRDGPARGAMLGLALAGTLSHVVLDFTNSYGVHPFWPLENGWFYGDAVFIVEPWLWVLAIPPLLVGQRSRVGRVLLALGLVAILAAAWTLGVVPRSLAAVLTAAALGWLLLMRALPVTARLSLALGAWLGFEALSFATSSAAREAVARAVPDGLHDVVLTAAAGNPLCFDAIVVEADVATYRASRATVAAWPTVRAASDCSAAASREAVFGGAVAGLRGGLVPSPREASDTIRWRQEWSAPLSELRTIARRCDVRAGLGFIRVPVWEVAPDGAVRLSDLRYGFGGDGFADLAFPSEVGTCPPFVPPWTPPRAALLSSRDG